MQLRAASLRKLIQISRTVHELVQLFRHMKFDPLLFVWTKLGIMHNRSYTQFGCLFKSKSNRIHETGRILLSKHVSSPHLLTSFSTQLPAYTCLGRSFFNFTTSVASPVHHPLDRVAFQKSFG